MKNFIVNLFQDVNGSVSSKRLVMFFLVTVFSICVLVNLFTGKNLDATLKDQLFYVMLWVISSVFGEQITKLFNQNSKS